MYADDLNLLRFLLKEVTHGKKPDGWNNLCEYTDMEQRSKYNGQEPRLLLNDIISNSRNITVEFLGKDNAVIESVLTKEHIAKKCSNMLAIEIKKFPNDTIYRLKLPCMNTLNDLTYFFS
eukprot:UN00339